MQEHEKITLYTAESPIKNPLKLFSSMVLDLRQSSDLGWKLFKRDISSQYRQSFLGYIWVLMLPIISALPFIVLNRTNIFNVADQNVPYPIFVIVGTTFFQLFVESINSPLKEIAANRAMLSKINVPKDAFLISGIGNVAFNFCIKLIVLTVVLVIFQIPLSATFLFALFPILCLFLFGFTIGIWLAPLGVLYHDIQRAITLGTPILLFVSPVAYPIPSDDILGVLMKYNPLTYMLNLSRDFLFSSNHEHIQLLAILFAINIVLFFLGWLFYRVSFPVIIERMEA